MADRLRSPTKKISTPNAQPADFGRDAPSDLSPAANAESGADSDLARVVMNDCGQIVFATQAFWSLCQPDEIPPALDADTHNLATLFHFEDLDDAFYSGGMFGIGRDIDQDIDQNTNRTNLASAARLATTLREGSHVLVFGDRHETMQFDRITIPGGKTFILASAGTTARLPDDSFFKAIAEAEAKTKNQTTRGVNKKLSCVEKICEDTPETELRNFLDMSHDLLSTSDSSGHFRRINGAFNTVLGYDDEQLYSMTFMDIVHPDDKPQVRNAMSALMYDDAPQDRLVDFEARLTAQDGSTHWMEWRHKRCGDVIYSVGRDATAFKGNEETLRQQELMLREAQSIGHMGHWRWIVGSNDIQWSDEIYNIFGVTRDDFVPALDAVNRMTHKRDVGRLLQAFQRAIIEQNNYDMEFRVIRPDGEIRHIRCEGRCEHDSNDEVIALFGIMQDVTERTINEQHLTEAKESAERAYAAKSQFLANMSHELRTPLNAIIGFSEMMQRQLLGPIGSDRYLDYIAGIRESGEHLLDLISDILDMSKIEAGKYELDLEELNIAKVIRLAIHMMEGRATEAKIQISAEIANEALLVVADRRALMQILLNLMSNSVKFTEPAGIVRVECIERTDYVSIKVHDNGIGIPANMLKNITRPFEQAASHYTRKHEGTGLGLSITKELVEMHGGSLYIESTVGVGTTVTIRLPYNAYDAIKNQPINEPTA